jgi:hypothetical protein
MTKTIIPQLISIDAVWYLLTCLIFGCAGNYSLKESIIRSDIPPIYRFHTAGIIDNPSDEDIKIAITFGKSSKDGAALEYAYLMKGAQDAFANDAIYVKVLTPLFLIANHSREQTREYKPFDTTYISFVRTLQAVQISLTQQFTNYRTYNSFAFQRQTILLRDGIRVESMKDISSWQGANPFARPLNRNVQATIAQSTQSYTRGLVANMTKEQRISLIRSYQTMGFSSDQIIAYTGMTLAEINELVPNSRPNMGKVALTEFDAIYSIEELKKTGKYEVIFRTPQTSNLISTGDDEIRLPISFSTFR